MDRGASRAIVFRVAESDSTEQLTHTHTHTHAHSQTSKQSVEGTAWLLLAEST